MLEPLIMSKAIFDAMPKNQKDIIVALGEELEAFGNWEVVADDQKVAEVYAKKGAKVADLDDAIVDKWRAIARDTAWKDYASAAVGGTAHARRARHRLLTRPRMVHVPRVPARGAAESDLAAVACRLAARFVNSIIVLMSSVALDGEVLTYSVASRYFLHLSTDWQDELVF